MRDQDNFKQKPIEELLKFSMINIDKPSGPTSFTVSEYVKKSLNLNKTSHGGTLDPQVSGVLPIFLGRACRLMDYFLHKDKIYVGIMRLHENVKEEKLKEEMKELTGKIKQLPPLRSRVARKERVREVKKFEMIEREGNNVLFLAEVEAGTYIRRLCDDVGKRVGGAHMLELRRTRASIFPEENAITLYQFDQAVGEFKKGNENSLRNILIPAESCILEVMSSIEIKSSSVKKILTGKPLMQSDITSDLPMEKIFALFHNNQLIAIVKKSEEKDILARPQFVFN